MTNAIVEALRGAIGEAQVLTDPARLDERRHDYWMVSHLRDRGETPAPRPACVVRPRSVADVVNVSSTAGRVARLNSGVYNATKFGVVAFSESLRQEVTARHVRVSIIEPGATATELASHNRPVVLEEMAKNFGGIELMASEDIADAITYVVTRPRHVAVNEMLIRPTEQER